MQDLSLADQLSPKSRNFPGELFRLRSLSEVSETMATIAKAACQRKRHSFSIGGCDQVIKCFFRWRLVFCWHTFAQVQTRKEMAVSGKCLGEVFALLMPTCALLMPTCCCPSAASLHSLSFSFLLFVFFFKHSLFIAWHRYTAHLLISK